MHVHPSAVVEDGAVLGANVEVGPFCHVRAGAIIGDDCRLLSHVCVGAGVTLGRGNQLHPFCVLGGAPQDVSYRGEPSQVMVGDQNVLRESVTVHGGTQKGDGVTRLGSHGLFMVGAHVAHDCIIGDHAILTNHVSLGGHVTLEPRVVLGGHVAVAPFCHLGRMMFAAGGSMIERDMPPFMIVGGDRARVRGVNRVGLQRGGATQECIAELRRAYRRLFRGDLALSLAAQQERERTSSALVRELCDFLLRPPASRGRRANPSNGADKDAGVSAQEQSRGPTHAAAR